MWRQKKALVAQIAAKALWTKFMNAFFKAGQNVVDYFTKGNARCARQKPPGLTNVARL